MTCPCSKPTRDERFVCDTHIAEFVELLGKVEWIDTELEITQTRQRGSATEGGSRSVETPLPWHDKASLARRHLASVLHRWGCDVGPTEHGRRVNALALQENGYDAFEQIDKAADRAIEVIDWQPTPRVYLGRCEGHECSCACHNGQGYACSSTTCTRPDASESSEPCEGEVYASGSEEVGYCEVCRRGYSVAIKRRSLEAELDALLYTATEISHLAAFLGLEMKRESVVNQINAWHRRERLTAVDRQGRQGAPRFRYGEVKTLLYAHKTRREGAAS